MIELHKDKQLLKKELEIFQLKDIYRVKGKLLLELINQIEFKRRKIHELEKLHDDLTHMIIHDFKNSLGAIFSSVELLKGELIGTLTDEQMKFINIIFFNTKKLSNYIMDLLEIRKLEEKKFLLHKEEFYVDELIANLSWIKDLASKDKKLVEMNISGLQKIFADKNLIIRVLENLLINAIKHTPDNGKVTLSIKKNQKETLFEVIDTGEGIPQEYIDQVFDKFFKVETQEFKTKIDTGLGLTFCKMAVEEHGGKIGVESIIGKGSRFYFTLPLEDN